MIKFYPEALVSLLFCVAAHAQTTGKLNGQWAGTTKSPATGNELQVQVKISDSASTWMYVTAATSRKTGPCLNRELPLIVEELQSPKFILRVDGASVILGCPSFKLATERVSEDAISGVFGDGRQITLKKQ